MVDNDFIVPAGYSMTAENPELLRGDGPASAKPRILLVDDSDAIRTSLGQVLERSGFEVLTAASVNEALRLIGSETFDLLLSDLHMPGAGDGLTVVSAMRHANPKAITLLFTGYPEMKQATEAILMQADEILVKPMPIKFLLETIRRHLERGAVPAQNINNVAQILEEDTPATIRDWLTHVDAEPKIITVPLGQEERCAHLPQLFRDLVFRLRNPLPLGTRALVSPAAAEHGLLRRRQGYSAAMMVEESRMLQVSIFQALQNNLQNVDFSLLLVGVMTIADEVDSQLAQAMTSFVGESNIDTLPVHA